MPALPAVLTRGLLVAGLSLCALLPGADDVIRIVSSLPRTGSANAQTGTIVNGIRMALDAVGNAITLDGKPYRLVYEDWDDATPERGQWDPAKEAENAKKAAADPDLMIYIGTYNSGAAKIAMPILNEAGLAMLSPANTAIGLTKPSGEPGEPETYRPTKRVTYFRVVPNDDIQGLAGARWIQDLQKSKVFILHDREAYGKGLADSFRAHAKTLGLTEAGYEGIDTKAANFRALFTKVKASGADVVYFGGTTQNKGGQLVKDLVASGLDAPFICPDGCFEKAFIDAAGAANCEGRVYVTFGGLPPDQLTGRGKAFVDAYRERFKAEPEAYAVYGYECGQVFLDALRRAGRKDRSAVIDALAATRDFSGALGTWSFDASGDTSLAMISGSTVRNGAFVFVKNIFEPHVAPNSATSGTGSATRAP